MPGQLQVHERVSLIPGKVARSDINPGGYEMVDEVKPDGMTPEADGQGQAPEHAEEQTVFPREYVEKLRREAAEYRTKLRDIEVRAKAAEEAKLIEQQQYKELAEARAVELEQERKARETLESSLKTTAIKNAVSLEAAKAGIVDPDDALRLADLTNVEVNQDGTVKGVSEAIAALVAAKPYLTSKQPPAKAVPPVGATNPGQAGQSGPPSWMIQHLTRGGTFGSMPPNITTEE